MATKESKIFKLSRLRFEEMVDDCTRYLKETFNIEDKQLTYASPFMQIIQVLISLGRLILYYLSDSLNSLNIANSYRQEDIRGLASLVSHEAGRPISARAGARIIYKETGNQNISGICYIPNKQIVQNALNGQSYIVLLGASSGSIDLSVPGNSIPCNLLQGKIVTMTATGQGTGYQSFNFSLRNYSQADAYWINVYVNSEIWPQVPSLLDLGYDQPGCVIKNSPAGSTGGVSLYFGSTESGFGRSVPSGATVICEFCVTDSTGGNISKEMCNSRDDVWRFTGTGMLSNGESVNLNDIFTLQLTTDLIFGTEAEDIQLTQLIAPHVSRSFVLANETNYRYFFARMNMFSTIEVLKGYASKEANTVAQVLLEKAQNDYNYALSRWHDAITQYGEGSQEATDLYEEAKNLLDVVNSSAQRVADSSMSDNTIYLLLIPDITKRISSSVNYFTCDESLFLLSNDEQANIIQMIEDSGQKIITMENRIIQPKTPRFAINANVKIWEGYSKEAIYSSALSKLSDYFINTTRKDIIPLSDITALLEGVEGIDSVKVWFDADVNNQTIYQKPNFYGIDEFGDVVLTRRYTGSTGAQKEVRDILPLFRGGFTSPTGVEYSAIQSNEYNSAFNLNIMSTTHNSKLSLENPIEL